MSAAYLHILVIDDDKRRAARMIKPFAAWGWEATVVDSDPQAALDIAAHATH